MGSTTFEGHVRGQTTFAGLSASGQGRINVHYGAAPQAIEQAPRPFSTIPFPPDPKFIRRPAISQWLQSTLVGPGCRAALVGLGGVGKSQIAIQYAYDTRRDAPDTYVLWVHASSSARFQEAYQDIAERLKLPGRDDPQQNVLRLVWRWLSDEKNGPWLMVIDNADDGNIVFANQAAGVCGNERLLASYIPKTGRGTILVTSRSIRVANKLVGGDNSFQVPVMEKDQAMQLLRVRLGEAMHDSDAASGLVVALDYLPLAIIQAASYIKRRSVRKTTIASYLEDFRTSVETKAGLLAREADDLRRDESASNAMVTTWQMTFDQVRRDRPSAIELLCFMSFFNPQGIPESALISYSKQEKGKDIDEDFEVLLGYSLIAAAADNYTLEMHALVQCCTQVWLSTFDDKERWRCKFLSVMSSQYPSGKTENRIRCRELDPHIESILKVPPNTARDILKWATILQNVAEYRSTNGKNGEAEKMNRQTLEARMKVLGAEHPHTLMSMNNLAITLRVQGKIGEAENMNRQTLEAQRKVLGAEHPHTLTSISNLALTLWAQGKNSEAEKMNRQTLEATTKVLGAEHPETLTSMGNLALTLWAQGKNSEAERMNRQTLEARAKVLGAEHPETLTSMSNLALTLWAQGKIGEAEKMNRQTLEAQTKVLGAEHPSTLTSMGNLALTLLAQGKNSEAEKMNRQTLEVTTKVLGAEHPDTLTSIHNLASTLGAQGKNGEAEKMNRQTLEVTTKVLGAEHPDTLTSMSNLASTLWAQGKNSEAEKMNRQTLEARTKVLGAEHPDTLTSMHNLAHTLRSLGERLDAAALLQDCVCLFEISLGMGHPHTQTAKGNLDKWASEV